ncbi:MAG TPA: methylated-DNA--[protein]-cysteine S-methyltransferase, partial [Alphaproteobacteria bacterium]|nr:methylated-DNA--[protein]-cysteine S-methyltransferase [Alphaproteobacteria bacterium]
AAGERGLRYIHFQGKMPNHKSGEEWIESRAKTQLYEDQLNAYFRGELRDFNCPLDLVGTEFQKNCWNALCRIAYGKTCTYAELAVQVGSPRAFRAVGQANHNNPVPIIVPCHRVIGANGALTGYGGGLDIKEKLLRLEGALPSLLAQTDLLPLAFPADSR